MPISSKRRRERKVRREVKNKVRHQQQQQRGGQQQRRGLRPQPGGQPNEMLMRTMLMLSANGNKNSNDVANSLNQKEMMVNLKNEKEKRKKEMKVMEENHKVSMEKMKNDYELVLQQIREELQKAKDAGVQNEHNAEVQQLQHDVEQQKQKNKNAIEIADIKLQQAGVIGEGAKLQQELDAKRHERAKMDEELSNMQKEGDVEKIKLLIKDEEEAVNKTLAAINTINALNTDYTAFTEIANQLAMCKDELGKTLKAARTAKSTQEQLNIYKNQKIGTMLDTAFKAQEAFKRQIREVKDDIARHERKRDILQQTELGNVDLAAENTMLNARLKNLMYDVDEEGNLTTTPIDYNARYQAVFTDKEKYNKNIRESKRSINSYEKVDDLIFNMNVENQKLSAEYNALGEVYDSTKYNANLKAIGEKKAEIDKLKEQIAEKKQQGIDTKRLEKQLKSVQNEVEILTSQNNNMTAQPVTPTKYRDIGKSNAEIESLKDQINEKKQQGIDTKRVEKQLKSVQNEVEVLKAQNDNTTFQEPTNDQFTALGKTNAEIHEQNRVLSKKRRKQDAQDRFEQEIDDKENENKRMKALTENTADGSNDATMTELINRQVAANKEKELNDQLRMTHRSEQEKRMAEIQANAEKSENIKATEDRIITEKVRQKQNEEESQRLLLLKQEQDKTARAVSQQKVNQELLRHRNENDGIIDATTLLTTANECIDNSNAQFRDEQEYIDNSFKRYKRMAATNTGFVPVVSSVLKDWDLPPIDNDDDIRKYTSNFVKAGAFEELINAIGKSMDELKEGEKFNSDMLDEKIDVEEVYSRLNQDEK